VVQGPRRAWRTRVGLRWGVVGSVLALLVLGVVSADLYRRSAAEAGYRCVLGIRCEAENAALTGTRTETAGPGQWPGFSGTNFVVGFEHSRTSIAWRVSDVPINNSHSLDIRYANYRGQDGVLATRTMTLSVNGKDRQVQLPRTQSWRAWSDALVPDIELTRGENTVELRYTNHDSGHVNIDFIEIY
jgi:hypothetical protein